MDARQFLEVTTSEDGTYCLLAIKAKEDSRIQKFFTDILDVVNAAQDFDKKGYDVYFALATFKDGSSRRVNNVHQIKSFYLDLDCGPSKDFTTQQHAIDELRRFSKALKLPKPLMVSSGRGIHVYWILKEAVSLDEWLPVAEQLKSQCAEHDFLADPAVTADAARVLRVVGTHNYKPEPPEQVVTLGVTIPPAVDFDEFADLLGRGAVPVPKPYTPAPSNAMMQALMGNIENKFGTIIKKINEGNGCKQLELIITDKENCTEPMWRAGLSIAKFCSDSKKAIHYISKGHEGYTQQATEEKVNLIKGPYLCTKFNEFNPKICNKCVHWKRIKSPIVLGKHIKQATEEDNTIEAPSASLPNAPVQTYVIPTYPEPYFRAAGGGVYMRSSGPDGEPEDQTIYHTDIYVVKRILAAELGEAILMRLHLPKDGVREFTIPLTSVTSREEFRKNMSMYGVAINRMDDLMKYTTTWVNELQATTVAEKAHRQFGWVDDEAKSFILGNQEIFADKIEFNPPASNTITMFPAFTTKGSLEDWKEMTKFLNVEGQEPYQYVMGASFGSALMQFMPVACSVLHLQSGDTGYGKTTAQFAGLSVWGDPKELILEKEDTYNTKMNRAEVYHNIPLFIDEVTNMTPKELSDMAYQYYSGRQKRRLNASANVERYNGSSWSFMTISSANASMIEKIGLYKKAPKAEAARILEFRVDKFFKTTLSKEDTDAWSKAIQNNYGHAAIPFVQYVIKNLDEVKELLLSVQKKVDKDAGLTQEHRFWSAGAACALTALIICRKLGLLEYDTKPVYKWILHVLKLNKNTVSDMSDSAEQTLNDYMNEHWGNVLWIKSTDDLRKQNNNGLDTLVVPDANPRVRLVARYETDIKRAYLVPKPLKEWCGRQQINYSSFVDNLKTNMKATKSKVRLSRGTHMRLPPTDVIIVDFDVSQDDED